MRALTSSYCSVSLITTIVTMALGAQRLQVTDLLARHARQKRGLTSPPSHAHTPWNEEGGVVLEDLTQALSLDPDSSMDIVQRRRTVRGTQVIRLQQRHQGKEVWNAVVTLETEGEEGRVLYSQGGVYRDLHLQQGSPGVGSVWLALQLCLDHHGHRHLQRSLLDVQVEPEGLIMFNNRTEPHLAYLVTYLLHTDQGLRRPGCFIDARGPGAVTLGHEFLHGCSHPEAKGVGGNIKVGAIVYGGLDKCLEVRRTGNLCYLENKYVRVVNNNQTYYTDKWLSSCLNGLVRCGHSRRQLLRIRQAHNQTVHYDCHSMAHDQIHGGFSPALDAFYAGTLVARMYEDWYDMPQPLGRQVTLRVHYGVNYLDAGWTGQECIFGDGDGKTLHVDKHPVVSLGVMGHEIAHGITSNNSRLIYFQQSGGINEAFSDMGGEAAEAYGGQADWMTGNEIIVTKNAALNYFQNPARDKKSIVHVAKFRDLMDPHYSSGAYRKVFYSLVHDLGQPIRQVYGVFLHANLVYWHQLSDFSTAACDVIKAAYDKGQNGSLYVVAFNSVGIATDTCRPELYVVALVNKRWYSGIVVGPDVRPSFLFALPERLTAVVRVQTSSKQGAVHVSVTDQSWGAVDNDQAATYAAGEGSVVLDVSDYVSDSPLYLTVTLSTSSPVTLSDVKLQASYLCIRPFPQPAAKAKLKERQLYNAWLGDC